MKKCPDCNGNGECVISCCTGDVITDDYVICSVCFEHCGEGECPDCKGSGKVPVEQTEFCLTYDAQLQADLLND